MIKKPVGKSRYHDDAFELEAERILATSGRKVERVEHAETTAVGRLIVNKIQRPARVSVGGDRNWCANPNRAPSGPRRAGNSWPSLPVKATRTFDLERFPFWLNQESALDSSVCRIFYTKPVSTLVENALAMRGSLFRAAAADTYKVYPTGVIASA